jgi:cytochrome P450
MSRPGTELAAPLTDPAFHAADTSAHYASMRAEAPVAWNEELGFWALSRHADVLAVSRDPATFCSSQGILLMDIERDLPELPGALLSVDPPEHQRYRRLVQPAFAPSRMRALEPAIRDRTRRLLDDVEPGAPLDVVAALALPLPLLVIADLLGLPGEDWPRYAVWSDAAIDAGTAPSEEGDRALGEMAVLFLELVARRALEPEDDLISVLAAAEGLAGEERLTDDEIMMLCGQLLVAGNETTRNLVTGGLLALADRPDQWDLLAADPSLVGGAVEELLRFTSPIISFLRTATRDTEVGGQAVAAGEHVLMLYSSANRDEAVFGEDAEALDVTRRIDTHLAFGFGEHFCLGAMLARIEARVVLEEVLARGWRPVRAGEPRRLPSAALVAGYLEAPMRFEPAAATAVARATGA